MLGVMVRLMGAAAARLPLNLLVGLYNDPTEWFWACLGIICTHGMFAATYASPSLELDNLLVKRPLPDLRVGQAARVLALAS